MFFLLLKIAHQVQRKITERRKEETGRWVAIFRYTRTNSPRNHIYRCCCSLPPSSAYIHLMHCRSCCYLYSVLHKTAERWEVLHELLFWAENPTLVCRVWVVFHPYLFWGTFWLLLPPTKKNKTKQKTWSLLDWWRKVTTRRDLSWQCWPCRVRVKELSYDL